MAEAIKFLHASDFHLDRSLSGLADIPAQHKESLVNAAYLSAERIFDLAYNERVDFVLLAGDIVDLDQGGPRCIAFLLSQFQRLHERGIKVYWCGGQVDQLDRWPHAIPLPENVVCFNTTVVDEVIHRRNGQAVATIFGCGYLESRKTIGDFRAEPTDPYPIALAHGQFDKATLNTTNIRYWAFGGLHKRSSFEKTNSVVVYPGTCQGRSPSEPGTCGCTLVRVDPAGKARCEHINTDVARWLPQKIAIAESVSVEDVKTLLSDRSLKLAADTPDQVALVDWRLTPTGEFNPLIRSTSWRDDVLEFLRAEFGLTRHGVWSIDLKVDLPNSLPPSWYEEDTILGDYLRTVGKFETDENIQLALHDYLPASLQDEAMAGVSRVSADRRKQILQRAALIGVEYLGLPRHDSEDD